MKESLLAVGAWGEAEEHSIAVKDLIEALIGVSIVNAAGSQPSQLLVQISRHLGSSIVHRR